MILGMNELVLAGMMAVSTGYPSADRHNLRDQGAVQAWQSQAPRKGLQAAAKVVGDAVVERFDLKRMEDPREWSPATALVGGAYVAAAGLKLEQPVGAWRLALRALPISQTGRLTLSRRF